MKNKTYSVDVSFWSRDFTVKARNAKQARAKAMKRLRKISARSLVIKDHVYVDEIY